MKKDRDIKDAKAIDITLFAVTAEELHTNANAKDWLSEAANHVGKASLVEMLHSCTRLTHSREDDAVGLTNDDRIVGDDSIMAKTAASAIDTVNVACVVFDDCYFHFSRYTIGSCCCVKRSTSDT